MSNRKSRLNVLLSGLQDNYPYEDVVEFLESCCWLGLKRKNFFDDVRTGICQIFYFDDDKHLDI